MRPREFEDAFTDFVRRTVNRCWARGHINWVDVVGDGSWVYQLTPAQWQEVAEAAETEFD